jgi:hypothetical protein
MKREEFINQYSREATLDVMIIGPDNPSFISIEAVASFFDVKADREYTWSFISRKNMPDPLLIAIVDFRKGGNLC